MATEVVMPSLGESVFEGTIAAWLKQEGDPVERYEPILEIETDKVTTEATAEVAGTVLKILVPVGSTVEVGTVLAFIGQPGEKLPARSATTKRPAPAVSEETAIEKPGSGTASDSNRLAPPSPAQPVSNGLARQAATKVYGGRISPVVGRIAAEHGVDLNQVRGTGREGRITKNDILAYIERAEQPEPPSKAALAIAAGQRLPDEAAGTSQDKAESAAAAPGDILPLTSMRRAIAEHMVRSKHTSPHVTTVFEVDFAAVSVHRAANKARFAQDGAQLTFTAYVVSAMVQALRAHPLVNSSWTEQGILLHETFNIGVAAAVDNGLIVPVLKNADRLSLLGLARGINDLATKARAGKLLPDEVQGATFTLTNHGTSGSLFATPIINQPQCAILGLGKIEKRVKVIDDAIAIRPLAFASLTFDHRILDGATADAFMATFKVVLEGWS